MLPKELKIIEEYAFSNCTNLKQLILPNTLESIGLRAFMNCRYLKNNVEIPESVTHLDDDIY